MKSNCEIGQNLLYEMGSILLMSAVTSVISPAVKRKKFRFFSSSHYRTLMRAKLWLSHRSRAGRKLCVVYATSARLSSRNTHSEDDMNSLFQVLLLSFVYLFLLLKM